VSRRLVAALLIALVACAGKDSGAVALALYGMIGSFVSRAAGGCYAVCEGVNQVCNPETIFCEHNPCGPGCGSSRHCDIRGPVPRCVEDSEPADRVQSPPPPPLLPVATPPP
jgi:hypothetical protein